MIDNSCVVLDLSVSYTHLVFNSANTEYSCKVPNSVSSVTVNAKASSTKAKVRGLGTKDLTVGKNTLPIRIIAEDRCV